MANTVLAFDFGIHHIGVAVGNEELMTSQAVTAITARDGIPNEEQMEAVFKEWQPSFIVVGCPLNMDGTEQDMTKRARKFGRRLMSRYHVPLYFKDERLSSVAAKSEIFQHQGGYRTLVKNKGRVDAMSAQVILEGFFDNGGRYGDCDHLEPVGVKKSEK